MIQNMNTVSSQTTQLDYRMRPAEKLEIAENLVKHILAKVEYFVDECEHTAKRAKRFPFFMKREYSTPYGKWLCVLTFFEKWTNKNGCPIGLDLYQSYEITTARNQFNNGIGLFHVTSYKEHMGIRVDEYPPHLIHRIAERYDESIDEMSPYELAMFFKKKTMHSVACPKNVTVEKFGEEYEEIVLNLDCGQILGLISVTEPRYLMHNTFISKNEMKDSQVAQNIIHKDLYDMFGSFREDRIPGWVSLSGIIEKYGQETANDVAKLLDGRDKSVRNSNNLKRISCTSTL